MGTRRRSGRSTGTAVGRRQDGATAVQLLPHLLAVEALGRPRVGDRLEVVPAIYAGTIHLGAVHHGVPAPEYWTVDEFGCVDARGTLTTVALDPAGDCSCSIEVLAARGRLAPVNWAATTPPEADGPAHVDGSLYLDPVLAAGTEHGEAVALCRRSFRLAAVRRYRRTASVPVRPVPLGRFPAPSEVSDDAVYVADLVAEGAELPTTHEGARDGADA
ncbi:hypothetical protein [Actinomycetospora sp. CA-084318]|uniref:hypothetical protein n=1 Tax=Actinomycetospora sp. CA-084318 TaxID=3239892 RepID=UPI003D95E318